MGSYTEIMPILNATSVLFIALLPVACFAQVFKCTDARGNTSFSDRACVSGQQSGEVRIYVGPPAVPEPARQVTPASATPAGNEAYDARMKAISDTRAEVKRIKDANYNPEKCGAARARMAVIRARDPIMFSSSIDYFEMQQRERLYCGS